MRACFYCKKAKPQSGRAAEPSDIIGGRVEVFHVSCWTRYRVERALAVIDKHFPKTGPCGICGSGCDGRHRILDTIVDRHWAGDSVDALSRDYDQAPEAIEAVIAGWNR